MSEPPDPAQWAAYAEKVRALAATANNDDTRRTMLEVAAAYDGLALQAEHWAEQMRLLALRACA
jgi:hypothetical protein